MYYHDTNKKSNRIFEKSMANFLKLQLMNNMLAAIHIHLKKSEPSIYSQMNKQSGTLREKTEGILWYLHAYNVIIYFIAQHFINIHKSKLFG